MSRGALDFSIARDGTTLELVQRMRKQRVAIAIAAVVAVAGVTSIVMRHGGDATTPRNTHAQVVSPKIPDAAIVQAVHDANLRIDGFSATNVGGIVVLKGTADAASAQQGAAGVKERRFAG